MRTASLTPLVAASLLGCHARTSDPNSGAAAASATGSGGGLSIKIPGVDARVALPALDLGRHVDLDGIKLAPGTRVGGIDVAQTTTDGSENGRVMLRFASTRAPADLLDYYRRSATAAGYDAIDAHADGLTAHKGPKLFALTLASAPGGSSGTITVTGG